MTFLRQELKSTNLRRFETELRNNCQVKVDNSLNIVISYEKKGNTQHDPCGFFSHQEWRDSPILKRNQRPPEPRFREIFRDVILIFDWISYTSTDPAPGNLALQSSCPISRFAKCTQFIKYYMTQTGPDGQARLAQCWEPNVGPRSICSKAQHWSFSLSLYVQFYAAWILTLKLEFINSRLICRAIYILA